MLAYLLERSGHVEIVVIVVHHIVTAQLALVNGAQWVTVVTKTFRVHHEPFRGPVAQPQCHMLPYGASALAARRAVGHDDQFVTFDQLVDQRTEAPLERRSPDGDNQDRQAIAHRAFNRCFSA